MPKNIVICSDGTWNEPDQMDRDRIAPSNVVKIARALASTDWHKVKQDYFYDMGVGTGRKLDKYLGGSMGIGLSKNVQDAYRHLVDHYQDGDNIFCFGFSRGAYTVRSLSGLLGLCGLLRKSEIGRLDEAYELYRTKPAKRNPETIARIREKSVPGCRIKFMGVWDTVGALGIPIGKLNWITRRRHAFHNVELSPDILFAYHALAIDEKRRPFRPSIWKAKNVNPSQTVEQVWFAGVHSNIGGGYVDAGLSDIAFLWMVEKAHQCGLRLDPEYIKWNVHPNCHGELRVSKKGIYKPFPAHIRPIGEPENINEKIHQSALMRSDHKTNSYAPKHLVASQGRVPIHPWRRFSDLISMISAAPANCLSSNSAP